MELLSKLRSENGEHKMTEIIIRYAEPSAEMDRAVIPSEVVGTLVRCKDCKYYHKSEKYSYCNKINVKGRSPKRIDFCSYGERKGGGE